MVQEQKKQVSLLSSRIEDLESQLASTLLEKEAISASKATLQDRYLALKKSTSQLESFRKSIATMINLTPALPPLQATQALGIPSILESREFAGLALEGLESDDAVYQNLQDSPECLQMVGKLL